MSDHFCKCISTTTDASTDRAVYLKNTLWETGQSIRISFLGGTTAQQQLVRDVAAEWTRYCNLFFVWLPAHDDETAHVRISFDEGDGSWSYVGTDATTIPFPKATMNFGWLDRGTILHEFGHMLGLAHEHQNPNGGLTWKRDVVIESLSGPPNYWDVATIEHNVLNKYTADDPNVAATAFDHDGIMLYFFPASWNREGIATKSNQSLSSTDKRTASEMYPFDDEDWEIDLGSSSDDGDENDAPPDVDQTCCGANIVRAILNAFRKR